MNTKNKANRMTGGTLFVRVSGEERNIINKAMTQQGFRTVSDFVRSVLITHAKQTVQG